MIMNMNVNMDTNLTGSFARPALSHSQSLQSMHDRGEHTVSFPPRRVSFAPNAHVRYVPIISLRGLLRR